MVCKLSTEIGKVYMLSNGLKESGCKHCPRPGTALVWNVFLILCHHSTIWEWLSGVFFLTGFSADKGSSMLQEG